MKTTGAGASIDTLGAILSGVTISAGSLVTLGSASSNTLQLYGNIANAGTIRVSGGTGFNFLDVGVTTLSGGGTIALTPSSAGNGIAAIGSDAVLTNVNNVISGAGFIGVANDELTFINSGVVNANVDFTATSGRITIDRSNVVSNAGLMEATNSGGLYLLNTTISNTSAGSVVASGGKAEVILSDSTILGGILRTSGGGAMIVTDGFTSDAIIGARIAAKSLIEAVNNATLTVSGGTMSAGAVIEAASNGTVVVSGTLVNSGGTVFASGVGGLVEIVSGAVVNGGIVEVGSGITIDSGAKVFLQSGGSAVDLTVLSGGSAVVSAGGVFDVVTSAANFGTLIEFGAVHVASGGVLTLSGKTSVGAGVVVETFSGSPSLRGGYIGSGTSRVAAR